MSHHTRSDEVMVPYNGTRAGNLMQYIKTNFIIGDLNYLVRVIYRGSATINNTNLTEQKQRIGLGAKIVISSSCKTTHTKNSLWG